MKRGALDAGAETRRFAREMPRHPAESTDMA